MADSHLAAYRAHLDRLTPAASSYAARYSSFQKGKDSCSHKTCTTSSADRNTNNNSTSSPNRTIIPQNRSKTKDANPPASSSTRFPVSTDERAQALHNAVSHTNNYYDMVTRSYEAGWSSHFHYCPFAPGDTIDHALKFYVYRLAILMGLKPGMKVLDVGCGIGGPARELAKLVGCEVVGVTINQFQVDRAIEATLREGLGGLCTFIKADFMRLDEVFPEGVFDAAFACEATCHAPSAEGVFAQVWRVLKAGAVFGFTDEVLTERLAAGAGESEHYRYEEGNHRFEEIRGRIEVGGGMASLRNVTEVRVALRRSGFEIEVDEDYARYFEKLSGPPAVVFEDEDNTPDHSGSDRLSEGKRVKSFSTVRIPTCDTGNWRLAPPVSLSYPPIQSTKEHPCPPTFRPWYYPILGTKEAMSLTVSAEDRKTVSKMSHWNRRIAFFLRKVYVWLGWSPPGLIQLNEMMELYIDGSIEGAQEGIFSPCWMFVCKKAQGACDPSLFRKGFLQQHTSPQVEQSGVLKTTIYVSDGDASAMPRRPVSGSAEEDADNNLQLPLPDIVDVFEVGMLAKP